MILRERGRVLGWWVEVEPRRLLKFESADYRLSRDRDDMERDYGCAEQQWS